MSGFSGYVHAALQLGLTALLEKPTRGLYKIILPNGEVLPNIVPQIVIEEHHTDNVEITAHPIQQGASIADHAFKRPAEITIQLGWSNSPSDSGSLLNTGLGAITAADPTLRQLANVVETGIAVYDTVNSVLNGAEIGQIDGIYQQLLDLQSNRALFVLYTGKRMYENMVCKTLSVETNNKTANALMVTMTCQQVILVNSETVTLSKATQQNPGATASPLDKGSKNTQPVGQLGK